MRARIDLIIQFRIHCRVRQPLANILQLFSLRKKKSGNRILYNVCKTNIIYIIIKKRVLYAYNVIIVCWCNINKRIICYDIMQAQKLKERYIHALFGACSADFTRETIFFFFFMKIVISIKCFDKIN